MHINLSLYEEEKNLFEKGDPKAFSFMSGIMRRMREVTSFANPIVSSYERLGQFEAPSSISWSHHNRSTLVRIPYAQGNDSRMEVRSPDPAANPYLLISLLLSAGFEGVADSLKPDKEAEGDMISSNESEHLPATLAEALEETERSSFVSSVIPEKIIKGYLEEKKREAEEYEKSGRSHEYLIKRYFRFV